MQVNSNQWHCCACAGGVQTLMGTGGLRSICRGSGHIHRQEQHRPGSPEALVPCWETVGKLSPDQGCKGTEKLCSGHMVGTGDTKGPQACSTDPWPTPPMARETSTSSAPTGILYWECFTAWSCDKRQTKEIPLFISELKKKCVFRAERQEISTKHSLKDMNYQKKRKKQKIWHRKLQAHTRSLGNPRYT